MFIIALISAVIVINLFYFDEGANGYKLWTSLPFTRNEIVSARYVSLLVISAIVIVLVIIFNWQFDTSLWLEVVGGIITILITASVCFPLFYLFAQKRVMFFLLTLYILFVIGAVHAIYYMYIALFDFTFIAQYLMAYQFYVVMIFIGIMIYCLSWKISLEIYNRKEII